MIVYNITTKVHTAIDAAWLQWQREEHMPAIMATGLFTSCNLMRLLEHDDSEGNTYAVQYTAVNIDDYHTYTTSHAPLMREKAVKKWSDKIISFRSVLEIIQ